MPNLKIGWGKRELSTEEPIMIPGQMYMRVSEGIHDPLYATALCVDGGEDVVIFCTCDLVVLRGGVIAQTRARVAQLCPEIPVDKIIMGTTHTHAGGCVTDSPEQTPDGAPIHPGSQYRAFFANRCAEAIVQAWKDRAPAGMAYGYGYAVVGHSRRVTYMHDVSVRNKGAVAPNGHAVMYGKTNDEWFSGYEAGTDSFLNLMFTFDEGGKLTGIVVNVPCPSQLSEHFTKLSADYWNEVRAMVAKEYGEDVYVLPQCAAAGDLSPRILHYKKAQARRMALKYDLPYDPTKAVPKSSDLYNKVMGERHDIAERILDGIRDVYSWARKDIQTQVPVYHISKDMDLQRRMITAEEKQWCEQNIVQMRDQIPDPAACTPEEYRVAQSRYNSIKGRNERAITRFETQNENPTLDTHIHVVRIGDIGFATTRFELYMDFMHRVQARSPFIQTFVVQLAGDEGGSYLPTQRGKANKGYSASLFCNLVGPEGGQQWVEEVLSDLQTLAEK